MKSENLETFEQRKTMYFSRFATRHLSEMRVLKKGGVLGRGNELWRNISEHCLSETVAADILAEALGADREKVAEATLLHDWFKRREVEAMKKLGGAKGYEATAGEDERLLKEYGVPDEIVRLAHSNLPENGDPEYLRRRPLEEKIIHFVDIITDGSNWVDFRDKLQKARGSKTTVEFSESMRERFGGKSMLELQEELTAGEEREFEEILGLGSGELMAFIFKKLGERIQSSDS